jgi:hypothetical protein
VNDYNNDNDKPSHSQYVNPYNKSQYNMYNIYPTEEYTPDMNTNDYQHNMN